MLSSELLLILSVVAAQIGNDVEGVLTEIEMDIGSRLDDVQKDVDETAVIEVHFEEIIL